MRIQANVRTRATRLSTPPAGACSPEPLPSRGGGFLPPPRSTRRRLAIVAAAIAIVVAVVGGIAIAGRETVAAGGHTPVVRGTDAITGKQVSLSQFAGRPVVLNVWASWCTGCNQAAADLARFATRHQEAQVLDVD